MLLKEQYVSTVNKEVRPHFEKTDLLRHIPPEVNTCSDVSFTGFMENCFAGFQEVWMIVLLWDCLLYTSDAADE